MATIRVAKRHRYTAVDRRTITDSRLSFGARGLLIWLLDKPDDWSTSCKKLAEESPEGVYAVKSMVRELETAGYLVRTPGRDAAGRLSAEWEVHEVPFGDPQHVEEPVDPGAETAPGEAVQPCAESAPGPGAEIAAEPGAETAPLTEDLEQKTENTRTPPTPPQAGGGNTDVVARFKGMGNPLPALTGIGGEVVPPGVPRVAATMATGGWSAATDVPSHAAALQAFFATVSLPSHVDRRDVSARSRESMAMGEHPGLFLVVLASSNTYTARAVGLARGIVCREMAEMPLVGLGVERRAEGKRSAMARQGLALHHKRQEERRRARASRVIDADSEEVP